MLKSARCLPIDLRVMPCMDIVMNPKMCSIRTRTFDFSLLVAFCSSVRGQFLVPFSSTLSFNATENSFRLQVEIGVADFAARTTSRISKHSFEYSQNRQCRHTGYRRPGISGCYLPGSGNVFHRFLILDLEGSFGGGFLRRSYD